MQMARWRKTNGFTLVEMLVAMVIFGTVMAGISVVFISSMRAWQTARENQSVFEMGRAALQLMERDIKSAFGSVDRNEMRTLVGTSWSLTFVGVTENPLTQRVETWGTLAVPHSDMARITYIPSWLLPDVADQHLLLRLVQPDVDEVGSESVWEITIQTVQAWNEIIQRGNPGAPEVHEEDFELAANILDLQFLYGVADAPTASPTGIMEWLEFERTVAWTNSWDSRTRLDHKLPDVIQVVLEVRADARMPTEETKKRVFRSTIYLPLGDRRPLPAVLQ
jgi:prepilin-type N-terminal cleavage/methylation domain-containing protein